MEGTVWPHDKLCNPSACRYLVIEFCYPSAWLKWLGDPRGGGGGGGGGHARNVLGERGGGGEG
eukprot:COSAG01_NODE_10616_length_2120_cov_110.414646_1_plen_62_part_10